MERYEKYKDSGVEWIGKIPEGWEVEKLKYIANARPSNIDKKSKDDEETVFLCNYVDVYNNEYINSDLSFMKATANQDQIQKFILKKGDVIATKDSETPDDIANPALVVEDFDNVVCGYHLTYIKPKEISGRYLFRYFQTKYLSSYFEVSANGVTRYGLSVDKFNSALILNPPLEDQTAIANYLDRKTAEINELIAQKERLIELYEEEKTAIINQAVTKGIAPDVETLHATSLRDSGIDWLGEIPKRWKVRKLKYGVTVNPAKEDVDRNSSELVVFLSMEKVGKNGEIDCSVKKPISDLFNGFTFFCKNDVIVAKITPCFENGKGAILNRLETDYGFGSTEFHVLRAKKNVNNLFLYYVTKSEIFMKVGEAFMSGAAGQKRVPTDFISDFPLVSPHPDDQTAIVHHIETESTRINTKITKTKKIIALQKEYRTALISEVVTGKIKVTQEAKV